MKIIPYGKQNIDQNDIRAVVETLSSDYLTQGPKIGEFESEFANYVGAKFAVAVANGTAALHLSCLALDVNPRSKVVTTPITFAASANCVRYCGGEVVFSDINSNTYLLDVDRLKQLFAQAPRGTYQGIIAVDFAGRAVNLEEIRTLANEYGVWVIEDACHAPGGYFVDSEGEKQMCGNGVFADLAIFSFHPVKHIATGEGGMITTNSERLYRRLLALRTHGITRDSSLFLNPPSLASANASSEYPGWYMEMQTLGFNYRLTDFQAALGLSQLKKADEGLAKRRQIAQAYERAFRKCKSILGQSGVVDGHAYHLYVIETEKRLELFNYLRTHGIYSQVHYIPVHIMPYYQQAGWKVSDMPIAEKYYSGCLSLPMFPALTDAELSYVIEKVLSFFGE